MSIFKNTEEENNFCNTQCANCMADMREDCNIFDDDEKSLKRIDGKVICMVYEPIPEEIAKLLNQDNGGQDNTFPMFDNWKPDIEVSESVLKEFVFFWTGKPDIKKTNEQWLQALAQSQQYADSRNEYYRNKGDNHG